MHVYHFTQFFGIKAELVVKRHLAIALMTISGISHIKVTALRTLRLPALVCILVIVTSGITLCIVLAVTLFSRHWVTLIPMSMAFTPVTHHQKYIHTPHITNMHFSNKKFGDSYRKVNPQVQKRLKDKKRKIRNKTL